VYVFVHLVGLAKETKLQVGRENRSNEKHWRVCVICQFCNKAYL
jgi:hypothetical protein